MTALDWEDFQASQISAALAVTARSGKLERVVIVRADFEENQLT